MAHKNNWFTAPFLDGDFSVRKLYVYQRDPEGRPWNEGTPTSSILSGFSDFPLETIQLLQISHLSG